jgi:small-conductance mechanosensitive channel
MIRSAKWNEIFDATAAAGDSRRPRRLGVTGRARNRVTRGATPMLLAILACLVWGVVATALAADGPPPALENEAEMEYARAMVTLDGEPLFHVRGVMAYPAEKRAQVIAGRIREVAADRSVPVDALRIVETEHGSDILAGDRFLMTVTETDTRREGTARAFMAQAVRRRIADAITAYRSERTPTALIIKTAYTVGATLLAGLLLLGFRRAFRWLDGLADRRFRARIEGLEAQSFRLVQAKQISAAVRGLFISLRVLSYVAILYAYLQMVLELFPWSRPLSRGMSANFLGPLGNMVSAVLDAVPNLIFIAVLVLVIRYLLKLVRLFFAGIASGTITLANFDREWAWPTYRIVRFAAIAFAVVVAYPYIPGSTSPAFQGVSIFIGVIFSLGSSSFISNLIAGYSMTYRRAFRVGDRIQVGDVTGDVTEIGLMVTRVRTVKNEEIVVPNSTILSNHIVNYSALAQKGGLVLHTTVGIGYETPWRQVEAMLLVAVERTPGLLKEPPPFVLHKALGDFCVTYEINVHCDTPREMARHYTELHRHILDVFNEYGVQIMTPAYEGDPEQPKVVPKEQWFAAPAAPDGAAGQPLALGPSGVYGGTA